MKKEKSMPIRNILDYQGNTYEITNAVIKRSNQLTKAGSDDLERFHNKPISLAFDELLDKRVSYRNKYEES